MWGQRAVKDEEGQFVAMVAVVDGCRVRFRNASDVPVTSVAVTVFIAVRNPSTRRVVQNYLGTQHTRIVGPSAEPQDLVVSGPGVDVTSGQLVRVSDAEYWPEVDLLFRDAGGRTWQRTADGELFLA